MLTLNSSLKNIAARRVRESCEWLRDEYLKRVKKNPQYSLRSFAKNIGVSPSYLSEIMSGKRAMTSDLALRVLDRLDYQPSEYGGVLIRTIKNGTLKKKSLLKQDYEPLSEEAFAVIADWYHFAILNVMKLKEFRSDPKWIAGRLGLTTVEVRSAMDRMKRLGMIVELKNGDFKRTKKHYVTTYNVPSAALRKSHRQSMEQALGAIESIPVELRDITSITFPTDLSKMAEVRQSIQEFQRTIAKLMSTSEATEVYNLNIQLVPVTKV